MERKMTFKLLAIDLDDTLLDSKKEISRYTVNIIEKTVDKGLIVVLATGRSFSGAKRYHCFLRLNTPMITCGGAEIVDRNGKEIYKFALSRENVKKILDFARQNKLHAQIENSSGYYFEKHNKFSGQHAIFYGFEGEEITSPSILEEIPASKILILSEPQTIEKIQPEAKILFPDLLISQSLPTFLEFNNPESSKGVALKFITSYFGLKSEQVIAFGDSELDLQMMECAGYCVAVGNAAQKILDMADYVTTSNNEDGVAEAIIKLVLQE
jgi:Cof subfamily protein (haloacid dehalogenase superfamily)